MIFTDNFFRMGSTHKICEDYAISGYEPFPYAILSDGCSASDNVDVGARIMCYLAKKYLDRIDTDDINPRQIQTEMGNWVILNAENVINNLNLNPRCLDCTLLVTFCINNSLYSFIYGDGCVIRFFDERIDITTINNRIIRKDKTYEIIQMPYYLSYELNNNRKKNYPENLFEFTNIDSCAKKDIENSYVCHYSNKHKHIPAGNFSMTEKRNLSCILICSDGIESFVRNNIDGIPFYEVIHEINGIEKLKTNFIKRKFGSMKGVIKSFEKKGITHYDDLAVAGMLFT